MAAPNNKASMDLVSLDAVKTHLRIETDSDHPELPGMIDSASRLIERFCRRKFKYQTYSNELYSGSGDHFLYINNPPLDSVTTVEFRLGQSWETQTTTYLRADDPNESGLIYWEDTIFPLGSMNIRITYVGGMSVSSSALDPVIVQAALEMTEVLWRRRKEGFHLMPSVSKVDGTTHVFRDDPMPRSVRDAIAQYRIQTWA